MFFLLPHASQVQRPAVKSFTGMQLPFVGYTFTNKPVEARRQSSHAEITLTRRSSTMMPSTNRLEMRIQLLEAELVAARANSEASDVVCRNYILSIFLCLSEHI
jgi:hypothetical protein